MKYSCCKSGEVTFKSFCDTWKVKPGGRGLVRRYFTLVDNERSEFGEDSLYFQVGMPAIAIHFDVSEL